MEGLRLSTDITANYSFISKKVQTKLENFVKSI